MDGGVEDTILVGDSHFALPYSAEWSDEAFELLSIIDLSMHQVTLFGGSFLFLWILVVIPYTFPPVQPVHPVSPERIMYRSTTVGIVLSYNGQCPT
jgi:hypothetical protein